MSNLIVENRPADALTKICLQTAHLLIERGADVNRVGDAQNPLSRAVAANAITFVALFLSSGADINKRDNADMAPLMVALSGYAQGYGLKTRAPSCLLPSQSTLATCESYIPMISLLLKHGADPNARDPNRWFELDAVRFAQGPYISGYTPLGLCARYGWYDVAKILLEHGADPSLSREDGSLPLEIAMENGHAKTATLIRRYANDKSH